ncbi:MAG TPA: rod shape-determining protein MreD [Frankiaceae bacterium]
MALRSLLVALLALVALVLQTTVVERLGLPLGPPQLLVLLVLVVALLRGPGFGMGTGFVTGLVIDLQGGHVVGRTALVLTLVAFLAGQLAREEDALPWVPVSVIGVGSVIVVLLDALLGSALGDPLPAFRHVVAAALGAGIFDAVLAPFLYPPLRALFRRLRGRVAL